MFLVNSRLDSFAASNGSCHWKSLSRSYGRFFAEFLDVDLLARLGLLDHPTGVGLRYGFMKLSMRRFSWKQKSADSPSLRRTFGIHARLNWGICLPISTPYVFHVQSMRTLWFSRSVTTHLE